MKKNNKSPNNQQKKGEKKAFNLFQENKSDIKNSFKPNYKLVKFQTVNGEYFTVRSCLKVDEYSLTVDHTTWKSQGKKKISNQKKSLSKSFEQRFGQ